MPRNLDKKCQSRIPSLDSFFLVLIATSVFFTIIFVILHLFWYNYIKKVKIKVTYFAVFMFLTFMPFPMHTSAHCVRCPPLCLASVAHLCCALSPGQPAEMKKKGNIGNLSKALNNI
jgi:hypothetical protein